MFDGYNADAVFYSVYSVKKRHLPSAIWMKGRWQIIWQDNFSNDESWKNWVTEDASPGHILSSRWRDNVRINRGRLLLLNKKETRGEDHGLPDVFTVEKCSGMDILRVDFAYPKLWV